MSTITSARRRYIQATAPKPTTRDGRQLIRAGKWAPAITPRLVAVSVAIAIPVSAAWSVLG